MQVIEVLSQLSVERYQSEVTRLMDAFDFQAEAVYFVRVLIAFILGCVIGLCHDRKKVGVGLKTYGSVALGSSIYSTISLHLFLVYNNTYAVVIAGGIVTGIGFLGAGIVFKEGASVRGLSSAATIWATAAIGLSSGAGMYFIAVAGTLVIALFHYFSKFHTALD